jgi:glycosyltransferase involved in cell wall biosynthesis
MKKILIVSDGFPPHSWGGAHSIAYVHAQGMQQRGYKVCVFTTTQDTKASTGWNEYKGLRVYTVYTNYHERWRAYVGLYNPRVISEFKKEIAQLRPDIVHFHNVHQYVSYYALALAKRSGAKIFLTAHDVMSVTYGKIDRPRKISWRENVVSAKRRFNPFRTMVIRHYVKKLDRVIAVSEALREALVKNGIGNVVVIHNGIDIESFQKQGDVQALRRSLGLDTARTVLFVGRFTWLKGSEVLLEAMQKVVAVIPNARLLVVGTSLDDGMRAALKRFSMEPYTLFQSNIPYNEVPVFYHLADVVVVPSLYLDPFPTVNLEAMAAGKPLVATCFGGSPEAVENGITGYIVNPKNTDELAEKIMIVLNDKDLAHKFGGAGHERAIGKFSLKRFIDAYEKLY